MGRKLPGRVRVTDQERSWRFTPDRPWVSGSYRLVIDTRLEDLAGNSIGRPFEVDVFRPVQQVKPRIVEVKFSVP